MKNKKLFISLITIIIILAVGLAAALLLRPKNEIPRDNEETSQGTATKIENITVLSLSGSWLDMGKQ